MKINILFICLFLATSINSFSQQSLLDSANVAYSMGNYEKAVKFYETIISTGEEASGLYYNLGNSYYKAKQIPMSILYYEKALRLDPANEDAKFNLQMAQRFVVDKIEVLPEFFLTVWLVSIVNINNSDFWAIYSVLSFILMLVLFSFFFFSKRKSIKKLGFSGAILCLFFSTAFLCFAHFQHKWAVDPNYAIIIAPSTTIKSTPDQSGTDLFLIHEGLKVIITDKVGDWTEIKLSNGSKGWMPEKGLIRI